MTSPRNFVESFVLQSYEHIDNATLKTCHKLQSEKDILENEHEMLRINIDVLIHSNRILRERQLTTWDYIYVCTVMSVCGFMVGLVFGDKIDDFE